MYLLLSHYQDWQYWHRIINEHPSERRHYMSFLFLWPIPKLSLIRPIRGSSHLPHCTSLQGFNSPPDWRFLLVKFIKKNLNQEVTDIATIFKGPRLGVGIWIRKYTVYLFWNYLHHGIKLLWTPCILWVLMVAGWKTVRKWKSKPFIASFIYLLSYSPMSSVYG